MELELQPSQPSLIHSCIQRTLHGHLPGLATRFRSGSNVENETQGGHTQYSLLPYSLAVPPTLPICGGHRPPELAIWIHWQIYLSGPHLIFPDSVLFKPLGTSTYRQSAYE